jgi:hypothetical protein
MSSGLAASTVAAVLYAAEEPTTAAEITRLQGKELFNEAGSALTFRRAALSDADILALTERLAEELPQADERGELPSEEFLFADYFAHAARTARGEAVDRLARTLTQLEPESYHRRKLLPKLAAAWINREVAAIAPAEFRVALPADDFELPDKLRNAPAGLVQAWQQFKRATAAIDKRAALQHGDTVISYQSNQKAFDRLVADVTLGRGEELSEQLLQYSWTGGCGTGSEMLEEPQSIALLMALLRERRIAEAVGASLQVAGEESLVFGKEERNVRIEFLSRCGLDWESLLAGALVDTEVTWPPLVGRLPHLRELASYGSDRAAALLMQLALRAKSLDQEFYIRALGALVAAPKAAGEAEDDLDIGVTFAQEIKRVAQRPISAKRRKEILAQLDRLADAQTPQMLASTLAQTLADARDRETIPALRRLVDHPERLVAEIAVGALNRLGEEVEMPEVKPPVQFRVVVNGRPLAAGTSVGWRLSFGNTSVSSDAKVEEDGVLSLPREKFLNAGGQLDKITISSRSSEQQNDWFEIVLPAPANLDEVITATADLVPVTVLLRPPAKRLLQGEATVLLTRGTVRESGQFVGFDVRNLTATVGQPLKLPLLQPGTYELQVSTRGAQVVKHIFVAQGAGEQLLDVQLQSGSDVRVEFVAPNGARNRAWTRLYNNHQPVDAFQDGDETYRGLPPGNYEIHVAGTDEEAESAFSPTKPGPDEVAYRGRRIAFTISENSPPFIDLGEIQLEPAGK